MLERLQKFVDEMKSMSSIYYTEEEYKNDPGINPMYKKTASRTKIKK